jgi:hypothetical protein
MPPAARWKSLAAVEVGGFAWLKWLVVVNPLMPEGLRHC